jgi:hypothetical protein
MLARLRQTPLLRRNGVAPSSADRYPTVETFCLFVGYHRSGHSLIGSLLDAHPEIVISHEAGALKLVSLEGISRDALFERVLENSRRQAARPRGRRASGYSYAVEGQWQGRSRELRVLGDKDGQKATKFIGRDPSVLATFERLVGVPLKIVHVTRNPYDVVARMALITKGGVPERSVAAAIDLFARLARANDRLISSGRHPVLTMRQEAFVRQPHRELRAACAFLGVDADDSYLDACAGLVFDSPRRTREKIEWAAPEVEAVRRVIERHSFLAGYSMSSVD